MELAIFLTSLPVSFEEALRVAVRLGFRTVDLVALADRPPAHLEALAEAGVTVSCPALGRDLPDAVTLDDPFPRRREAAVEAVRRQIADAGRIGAPLAYLIPGMDGAPASLARFADSCIQLADAAAARQVRLCVEHFPGRALPTAIGTLDWLETLDHPNLFLLLDVGHCSISREDSAEVVRRAGKRLGYVHLDDNDGQGDLHWALCTGMLTEATLRETFAALREVTYDAALSLELNPSLPDPVRNLREGKALVERLLGER